LSALTPRFFGIGVVGAAFIGLTIAITAGVFKSLDQQVADAMHSIWQPSLHVLFQAIAELGGIELTTILMVGLAFYLWSAGFGTDAFAVIVFIAAEGFEIFYRYNLHQPGPPRSIAQADGPSLSELFSGAVGGNSFPSGHMLRTVIAYGLIAFVILRLSDSARVRALVVVAAVTIIVLMAFDRLYLDLHWESDVIGGLLLGAIALIAGTVWLDRPRRVPHH